MPVIYIDLDGTLLDVWPRYYTVMNSFFENVRLSFPSLDDYRRLKLQYVRDEALIRLVLQHDPRTADDLYRQYADWKRERLESEDLLRLDRPIGNLRAFADRLPPSYRLNLISVRRNRAQAMDQLQRLEMIDPFERIDFVSPTPSGNPKQNALSGRARTDDLIVGDSEIDVACGSILGLRTFHVRTGLRSYAVATLHHPAARLRRYGDVLAHL